VPVSREEYRDFVGHRVSQVNQICVLALHPGVFVVLAEKVTGIAYLL
jgi:hypothetical protein